MFAFSFLSPDTNWSICISELVCWLRGEGPVQGSSIEQWRAGSKIPFSANKGKSGLCEEMSSCLRPTTSKSHQVVLGGLRGEKGH